MSSTDSVSYTHLDVYKRQLLLLYVLLAVSAATRESNVFDEALHLTAGYLHWTHPEEKLWPENGVFAQAWASLPLLFDHLNATQAHAALPRNRCV